MHSRLLAAVCLSAMASFLAVPSESPAQSQLPPPQRSQQPAQPQRGQPLPPPQRSQQPAQPQLQANFVKGKPYRNAAGQRAVYLGGDVNDPNNWREI